MIGDRTPTMPGTPMPTNSSSGSFDRNRTGRYFKLFLILKYHPGPLTPKPDDDDLHPTINTLPWKPKVREIDIEIFLEHERQKFFDYQLVGDSTTIFGLPIPIHQSVAALRNNVYESIADIQV